MRKFLFTTILISSLTCHPQIKSGRPSDAYESDGGPQGMPMKNQWILLVALIVGGLIIYGINVKNKK